MQAVQVVLMKEFFIKSAEPLRYANVNTPDLINNAKQQSYFCDRNCSEEIFAFAGY